MNIYSVVVVVQSVSHVWLFATPWTAAARLPCPSPTHGACSNSSPSGRRCYPTISSSVTPFSSCLPSFPVSGSFSASQILASGSQSIGASASASVLPMNIQDWFPLGLTGLISLLSKGLSRVFSNITVQNRSILRCSAFFMVQLSHWYMTTGKTIALTIQSFVPKLMYLLFNMLSRFVITFLPRSKHFFNFMAAVTIRGDFEAQGSKTCHCFYFSLIYFSRSDGARCHDLSFLMLSFKPAFSLSSFTLIKRLLSSFLICAVRVHMSYAYVRLLIFLKAVLMPACNSSSPAFHMMYSANKLNQQGDNIQTWCFPFSVLN